jgi:hypothetical protein
MRSAATLWIEAGRFSIIKGFDSTEAYILAAVGMLLLKRMVLVPEAEVSRDSAVDSFSSVCQGSPEHRERT